MTKHATAEIRPNVVGLQERRLDRTILRTYRTTVDLDGVLLALWFFDRRASRGPGPFP